MSWYYNDISGEEHHATNPIDNAAYASLTHAGIHWHEYATEAALLASVKAHHWKTPTKNPLHGITNTVGSAPGLGGIAAIGDFFARLTEPNTWVRIGEFVAGVILIYVGVKAMFPDAVKSVTAPVRGAAKGFAFV